MKTLAYTLLAVACILAQGYVEQSDINAMKQAYNPVTYQQPTE